MVTKGWGDESIWRKAEKEEELMREIHDADYISRLACSRLVKALPADSDSAILNGNLKFIHSISKLKQYRYNA